MNGAEALLKTVAAAGIDVCFANGGTTEMPMILAFDTITGIKPMLGLFEGVCSGAADGYGRMKEKPALCLLHLGPGLANGVANLHNAKRARTPLLNVIGEHASWHLAANAPLAMDIECLCKTFSGWQRTVRSAETIARDTADAIEAALRGQIASLIVPCDLQWKEYGGDIPAVKSPACERPDRRVIESAAKLLKSAEKTALIMNGRALRRRGLEAAGRIRAAVGCDLFCINFPAYVDRGTGTVPVARVPYFPEPAAALLAPYKAVVLAGTDEPVNFFGYEGQWSNPVAADVPKLRLDIDSQDAAETLEALADELGAPGRDAIGKFLAGHKVPDVPSGRLTPEKACLTLAALQPDGGHVVLPARRNRCPPQLLYAHRGRHRARHAFCHRGRRGLPRQARHQPAGRRQRHVHGPVSLDAGPGGDERDDAHLLEPQLQHHQRGAAARRDHEPRPQGPVLHGPGESPHRLAEPEQGDGCARRRRRHGRRPGPGDEEGPPGARPAPDRDDLVI
jgi:acetolactate synthase-1/2/3 large subunit